MQYLQGTFASGQRYVPNINSSLPCPNSRLEQTSWLRIFLGMIVLWIICRESKHCQKHYPKRHQLASYITTTCAWGSPIFIYTNTWYLVLCYISCISYFSRYITSQIPDGQPVPWALPSSYTQPPGPTLLWTTTRISVPFSLTLPTDV